MIVELRTYTFHPGKIGAFMEAYRAGPCELQQRVLGNLLGYYTTETGQLNQTVHLWGYCSFEDRLARRAELMTYPLWTEFLSTILPLLQLQKSKLLLPADLSASR